MGFVELANFNTCYNRFHCSAKISIQFSDKDSYYFQLYWLYIFSKAMKFGSMTANYLMIQIQYSFIFHFNRNGNKCNDFTADQKLVPILPSAPLAVC